MQLRGAVILAPSPSSHFGFQETKLSWQSMQINQQKHGTPSLICDPWSLNDDTEAFTIAYNGAERPRTPLKHLKDAPKSMPVMLATAACCVLR